MTDQVGMPHSAVHTRKLKSMNLDTDALSPESLGDTCQVDGSGMRLPSSPRGALSASACPLSSLLAEGNDKHFPL